MRHRAYLIAFLLFLAPAFALAASPLEARGCTGCHSLDGSPSRGPSLLGIAGQERKLASGGSVLADRAYLKRSITAPSAEIVGLSRGGDARVRAL